MQIKSFDAFQVGDFAEIEHSITEEDVAKFAELTGDDNPIHVNRAFAKKTVFKDVVVHGMLGASFISTLIGKYIPGNGALWISQNFEFLIPVRLGDKLSIHAQIVEKYISQRTLVLETKITNQYKQVVLKGTGKVKCLQLELIEEVNSSEDSKVILIIGASRGIGASTAEYLAKKKYKVVINYSKDKSGADSIVNAIRDIGGDAIAYQADVINRDAVANMNKKIIHHYGTISGLVYCASSKIIATDFQSLEWDDIASHFGVQVRGAFNCVQETLKEFIPKKQGSIVFIGSLAADSLPFLKYTGYSAAKAALHTLAKSLALEYGPAGIRVNIVSPGMTETGLIADVPEKVRLLAKMQIPLRRLAQPQDIAGAIEFLLSDQAKHITGETLRINGGQIMI